MSEIPAQPSINIGTIGHVDHGKTTLIRALTGKWADTHSEEMRRGITIRLGYAHAVFRKCPKCEGAAAYTTEEKCAEHDVETEFVRKVSFVDAPGHESLMATMLSGATIMDSALLLVAANEECPQPQTREHLMALQIANLENVIVVQNKIDVVTKEEALENYKQIREFLKDTKYADVPIIPVSAMHNVNIDVLIQAIEEYMPTPERDLTEDPMMLVARSFDVNKPGIDISNLQGGVLGGVLTHGKLSVGDKIEIKPGRKIQKEGKEYYESLRSEIVSMMTGGKKVDEVTPGGNIAIQTLLDPSIVKSDQLTGSVVGKDGELPPMITDLDLEVNLLEEVVGVEDKLEVEPVKLGEMIMLNVNSGATVGRVVELGKDRAVFRLKRPVCAWEGTKVTMSRRIASRFRLIGYGIIKNKKN